MHQTMFLLRFLAKVKQLQMINFIAVLVKLGRLHSFWSFLARSLHNLSDLLYVGLRLFTHWNILNAISELLLCESVSPLLPLIRLQVALSQFTLAPSLLLDAPFAHRIVLPEVLLIVITKFSLTFRGVPLVLHKHHQILLAASKLILHSSNILLCCFS